jgi:hypothetical protein
MKAIERDESFIVHIKDDMRWFSLSTLESRLPLVYSDYTGSSQTLAIAFARCEDMM